MSADVWVEPWYAHEHPERPLDASCWLCTCSPCSIAVQAAGHRDPSLRLVVKRNLGRSTITPAEYLEPGPDATLEGPHDYVREVFVRAPGERTAAHTRS